MNETLLTLWKVAFAGDLLGDRSGDLDSEVRGVEGYRGRESALRLSGDIDWREGFLISARTPNVVIQFCVRMVIVVKAVAGWAHL